MILLAPSAIPHTYAHEYPVCQRCPKCHPGKNYSPSFCRVETCTCHKRVE